MRDSAFHVGPVFHVVLAQPGGRGPGGPGLPEQVIAGVQDELAAGLGGGAPLAQRAVPAHGAQGRDPVQLRCTVCPAGQLTVPCFSPTVNPPPPGLQRLGLDHRVMAGLLDRAAQVPGAVAGVAVPGKPAAASPLPWLPAAPGASSPPPSPSPPAASAARNSSATAGSEFSWPAAMVRFSSVMIPVSGSAATCSRRLRGIAGVPGTRGPRPRSPCPRRPCGRSATARQALRRARHPARRPGPAAPARNRPRSSRSRPCSAATTAFASLTSADTSASLAAGSSQPVFGLPGPE